MAHRPLTRSVASFYTQSDDSGRQTTFKFVNLDAFVSNTCLPCIQLRKRSWRVDERIARQYLSSNIRCAGNCRHTTS